MKPTNLFYGLLPVALMLTMVSCKKNGDGNNNNTCRIVSATQVSDYAGSTDTTVYQITYTNDGKPATILQLDGGLNANTTFTYSGNTILISRTNGIGNIAETDSITLNGSGRIINARSNPGGQANFWYNESYQYDGSGNLQQSVFTSSSNSNTEVTTYTTSNGDITSATQGQGVTTYEYFTDKPYQPGDPLQFNSLMSYGTDLTKNTHLLKKMTVSGDVSTCTYETDVTGKITRATFSSGTNSEIYSYQYQCD